MGAQWKHSIRQANNQKKGAIVSKLVKEIMVAAKMGGADPTSNFRLRTALEDARKNSVTRDAIDRAVKKGAGIGDDAVNFESILYEGFAPHNVPVLVECLTDNKNRTVAEIRGLFRKGRIGAEGSVSWMFDRKGTVLAHYEDASADLDTIALEAGADDVSKETPEDDQPKTGVIAQFLCDPSALAGVSEFLGANKWNILSSQVDFLAKTPVELQGEALKEVEEFLGDMNDNDDVHRIYTALKN